MTIDFYYIPESPPCRTVELVANQINVGLNKKFLNLAEGEHLKEDFLKINPQHTVPTIVDGDLVLTESRAIITYLVNRYGSEHNSLYPKDPVERARVDMMLFWDLNTFYKAQSDLLKPMLSGITQLDETKEKDFRKVLNQLNTIVSEKQFCCGNELTLADISIICGLTFSEACEYDITEFNSVVSYIGRVKKSLPTYDAVSADAMVRFKNWLKSKRSA